MKIAAAILTLVLLSACSASYQLVRPDNDPIVKLSPERSFLVISPEGGSYGSRFYQSSGKMTADAVAESFSKYAARVDISEGHKGEVDPRELGRDGGYDYVVVPKITRWEDRATEWSGKPDRITILISVYDVAGGSTVNSAVLHGKSKWATFGGDHPQDLLPKLLGEYAKSLFK